MTLDRCATGRCPIVGDEAGIEFVDPSSPLDKAS